MVEKAYSVFFSGMGPLLYLLLYLCGIVFSSLPAYKKYKDRPEYRAVGASGAVSGIVFTSILINPVASVYILFIPFGIPAFLFGVLYLVYEAYMIRHSRDNVAHDAHFWGALFGIVFTIAFKPVLAVMFIEQVRMILDNLL